MLVDSIGVVLCVSVRRVVSGADTGSDGAYKVTRSLHGPQEGRFRLNSLLTGT